MISGGVQSGLQESCTRPPRSRRSRNTNPPRSRRRWTQPPSRTWRPTSARVKTPARSVRSTVAPGARPWTMGLTRFGVDEEVVELIRGLRLDQLLTDGVPPHQPGDATQDLDVQAGRRLRPHDEKKQADRIAIDGIVGNRLRGHAADHDELLDSRTARVRNGDAESDAGAEDR